MPVLLPKWNPEAKIVEHSDCIAIGFDSHGLVVICRTAEDVEEILVLVSWISDGLVRFLHHPELRRHRQESVIDQSQNNDNKISLR